MTTIHKTTVFVLAAVVAGARPPQPGDIQTALADFDFATGWMARNYAGYADKTDGAAGKGIDARRQQARERIAQDPGRFDVELRDWLAAFDDKHVGLAGLSARSDDDTRLPVPDAELARRGPRLDVHEDRVRVALARRKERGAEDPVEGIWESAPSKTYRIGVVPNPEKAGEWLGVVLTSNVPSWSAGQVKLRLQRARDGRHAGEYYQRDHTGKPVTAELRASARLLDLGEFGFFQRVYPVPDAAPDLDRYHPSSEFFLRPLSPSTLWLRLANFRIENKKVIDTLLDDNRTLIAATPNLLIDLRDSGGGSDATYARIIPLLYTQPIYEIGAEVWATAENTALLRQALERPEIPDDTRKTFLQIADRMERQPGEWVAFDRRRDFSVTTGDGVLDNPRHVGILITNAISAGEQFVLSARQSRKVRLFGGPTAGVIDYSNRLAVRLPSGRFELRYPISRSLRLPEERIDGVGIPPDTPLGPEVDDPIGAVRAWLERQVD